MAMQAYLDLLNIDVATGRVAGLVVWVGYGPRQATITMHLDQPAPAGTPSRDVLAAELRDLGQALLHIAETPQAIVPTDPRKI